MVPRMDDTMRRKIVVIYRDAIELIRRYDYDPEGWVYAEGGPNPTGEGSGLNVRGAIAIAITNSLLLGPAYKTHIEALRHLVKPWGGELDGITSWETKRRRTQTEVIEMLQRAVDRLEAYDRGKLVPHGGQPRQR